MGEDGLSIAASQEVAVQTTNLRKVYGKLVAVDDLCLSIPRGECYGLIGPNGAGKTTTLRMLATLLEPTDGLIRVLGHDAEEELTAVRRRIGFMPDDFGVYNELKVWEYLDYFATAYGVPKAQRRKRAHDVIELVDLQ
ncbi:MAG: ABC transporter ATP-binding protein, partial [Armatimonadetes bacterium CG_4_8_14_3_um_filter_66_20]